MPYLHWETDRRRNKFEDLVHFTKGRHKAIEAEKIRIRVLPGKSNTNLTAAPSPMADENHPRVGMVREAVEAIDATYKKDSLSRSQITRTLTTVNAIIVPRTVLGNVLYRAALIWESMDCYQDQELIREYQHNDPPLHLRRTLDQSYYWTLKSTRNRDRDQVVYRGTSPRKELMHSGTHVKYGCEQCQINTRKIPRLVMVDQLWLWILDGST
jgi:hypothetical protein